VRGKQTALEEFMGFVAGKPILPTGLPLNCSVGCGVATIAD